MPNINKINIYINFKLIYIYYNVLIIYYFKFEIYINGISFQLHTYHLSWFYD